MLHIRVVVPPDRRAELETFLVGDDAVINVVSLPGAARCPDGDLVQFDVASEAGNRVIESLRELRLERDGSISVERIDMAFSDVAALAEAHAPGDSTEAVLWEEVEARVRGESTLTLSFVILLTAAVLIAAVGILTDSSILIVGAMVVGPEYGPLSSMALGIHKRRPERVWRGVRTLVVGFPIAVVFAAAMSWVLDLSERTPAAYEQGVRPLTGFISHPDIFTVIVAAVAAVAGVVSITQAKNAVFVGVVVSVTTVPAAANIGVAIVHARYDEAWGALIQLVLNCLVIVVVGAGTLRLVARLTRRLARKR